jgi:hypothetical protein
LYLNYSLITQTISIINFKSKSKGTAGKIFSMISEKISGFAEEWASGRIFSQNLDPFEV